MKKTENNLKHEEHSEREQAEAKKRKEEEDCKKNPQCANRERNEELTKQLNRVKQQLAADEAGLIRKRQKLQRLKQSLIKNNVYLRTIYQMGKL